MPSNINKMPWNINNCPFAGTEITVGAVVTNPFSNEECYLNPVALATYDVIKGAEIFGRYDLVRRGLDWFRQFYPKEYMVLLD